MDNFSIDTGTQREVERANDSILSSLREQGRVIERNAEKARQLRQDADPFDHRPQSVQSRLFQLRADNDVQRADYAVQRQQFERMLDDSIRKKAQTYDAKSAGMNFGRRDIRDIHGLINVLRGDVNVHTLRETTNLLGGTQAGAALGIDKLAQTMGAVAGPLMLGQMAVSAVTSTMHEQIKNEQETSHIYGMNIDTARELGISGNVRKRVEGQIAMNNDRKRKAELQKHKDRFVEDMKRVTRGEYLTAFAVDGMYAAFDALNEGAAINDDTYKRLTGAYAKEDQEEQTKALKTLGELHKPENVNIANRLVSPEEVFRRAMKGASSVDVNEIRDMLLADQHKAAENLMELEKHKNEHARAAQVQHETRMTWDPLYTAQWRNLHALQKVTEEKILMDKQGWNET